MKRTHENDLERERESEREREREREKERERADSCLTAEYIRKLQPCVWLGLTS